MTEDRKFDARAYGPAKSPRDAPVCAFQTRAVLSLDEVAISRPVGAEAHAGDDAIMTRQRENQRAGVGIPDAGAVILRARCDPQPIGTENRVHDRAGVAGERGDQSAVPASQIFAVPSREAVTTNLPSGLNSASSSGSVWPFSVSRSLPFASVPDFRRGILRRGQNTRCHRG